MLFIFGCQKIEPAPKDVDGLAHYLWQNFDGEVDDSLAEGIINLHQTIDADNLSEIQKGSISALTQEEINLVGKDNQDASLLNGVYFANIIPCSVEFAEQSIYATNQDELHPGDYVRYDRSYTSDFEAYTEREEFALNLGNQLPEETGLAIAMKFGWIRLCGMFRAFKTLKIQKSIWGPAFLSRGVLREVAYFDEDSTDRGMFQDFQLEVYWPRAPKETVHFYFIWREMVILGDMDFNSGHRLKICFRRSCRLGFRHG